MIFLISATCLHLLYHQQYVYFYLALWVTMFMSERQKVYSSLVYNVNFIHSYKTYFLSMPMMSNHNVYVTLEIMFCYDMTPIRIIFPFSINIKEWKSSENIQWCDDELKHNRMHFPREWFLNGIPMTILIFLDVGYFIVICQKLICVVMYDWHLIFYDRLIRILK